MIELTQGSLLKEVRPLIRIFSGRGESRGRDALLQRLYEAYDPLLFRIAARYFPESPEEREDAVQNAWEKVIRSADALREVPEDRVPYWLACVVKNEAVTLLRRRKKHLPLEEWAGAQAWDEAPHGASVLELIRSLPETYRAVLEMKFVEGFTNREIAKALRISESAVGTRVQRGRALLKERLEAEGVKT